MRCTPGEVVAITKDGAPVADLSVTAQ